MTEDSNKSDPVVLTVAGFDPSGGSGIIADVRTILCFGCRPVAAITSLTFQNTEGVFGAIHESAQSVRAQILPVIEESLVAAAKTGMLPTAEIVLELAQLIRDQRLPQPVIDPVIRSSSGYELMDQDAIEVLRRELIPLARLITPNIPEAEALAGVRIEDEQGMQNSTQKLREMGARAVLVKGGHLPGARAPCPPVYSREEAGKMAALPAEAIDILDDEGEITIFRGEWIDAPPVRGTGCMMSSAIASCLAQGVALNESVRLAKEFVAGVRSPRVSKG